MVGSDVFHIQPAAHAMTGAVLLNGETTDGGGPGHVSFAVRDQPCKRHACRAYDFRDGVLLGVGSHAAEGIGGLLTNSRQYR